MNRFTRLAITAGLGLGLLGMAGCGHTRGGLTGLQLEATGDPGVEVRIVARRDGAVLSETKRVVPASMSFEGENLDVLCIHGDKPGELRIRASSGGNQVTLGTAKLGSTVKIELRRGMLKASSANVGAAGKGI